MKNDIRVSYPKSKYKLLNNEVENYIYKNIQDFKEQTNVFIQDVPYSLYIYYEQYETNNYLSYVFHNSIFTGGAHPNPTIYTINFDKRKNKIITINDLVKENPNILNLFSNQVRMELEKKSNFQNPTIKEMLLEGTTPKPSNFENFAFTEEGILLYFAPYQIAPYYMGSFQVLIK